MITRDFLLRQIHQLAQALAQVLFRKQAGQYEEAQDLLGQTLRDVTGLDPEGFRQLPREALLALCTAGQTFSNDKALALADLLREDETPEGRQRSLWLYEEVLQRGDTVPFDVHERLAALRASLPG